MTFRVSPEEWNDDSTHRLYSRISPFSLTYLTWNGSRLPSAPVLSIISHIRDCLISLLIAIVLLTAKQSLFVGNIKDKKKQPTNGLPIFTVF
jgi:hypothetical protein